MTTKFEAGQKAEDILRRGLQRENGVETGIDRCSGVEGRTGTFGRRVSGSESTGPLQQHPPFIVGESHMIAQLRRLLDTLFFRSE